MSETLGLAEPPGQGPAARRSAAPWLTVDIPRPQSRPSAPAPSRARRRWAWLAAILGGLLLLPVVGLVALILLSLPAEEAPGAGAPVEAADTATPGIPAVEGGGRAASRTADGAAAGEADPAAIPALTGPQAHAELARLRAAIAAERARLAALERQRDSLIASIEALRREATEAAPPDTAGAPTAAVADPDAAAGRQRDGRRPASAPAVPDGSRIWVHHRAGAPAAERAAALVAAALRNVGLEPAGLRPVAAVPSVRLVRYFHAADAPAAAQLAAWLGPGWAIQDFRAFSPSPPLRTLEIWLPDR